MVNIHFYDALASGANPQEGQVLRYHCIRVGEDGSFQTKKSAVALRDDVFIDPQYALDSDIAFLNLQEGVSELEWAKSVYQDFTSPQSLFIGLGNSTRVDPALRQVFYRSLLPYPAFGFPAGAHYLDIETLLAAILVLRPTEYPFDPKIQPGKGSALYQYLMWDSSWEGDNRAQRIRDVLAEVAKRSPRMLEHAISISGDKSIRNFLGLEDGAVTGITGLKPVVGIHSSLLTSRPVSVLVPMAVDPSYPDFLYMIDLESDLTELLSAKDESLSKCVRKNRSDLTKPLIRVSLSKLPFFAPIGALRGDDIQRLQVNSPLIKSNMAAVQGADWLCSQARMENLFDIPALSADVDSRLWAGDFRRSDQQIMRELHAAPFSEWLSISQSSHDERLPELVTRALARQRNCELPTELGSAWEAHVRHRLAPSTSTNQDLVALYSQYPSLAGLTALMKRQTKVFGSPE